MSDKIGPVNLGRGEDHPFLGMELAQPKRYSEQMAWMLDQEIQRMLLEAESMAFEVLSRNKTALVRLAEDLIREETLDKTAVDRIINESRQSDEMPTGNKTAPNP
jgi:cell division protease FtsH